MIVPRRTNLEMSIPQQNVVRTIWGTENIHKVHLRKPLNLGHVRSGSTTYEFELPYGLHYCDNSVEIGSYMFSISTEQFKKLVGHEDMTIMMTYCGRAWA